MAANGPTNRGKPMPEPQRAKLRAAWEARRDKWPNGVKPGTSDSVGDKLKDWWADPANSEKAAARRAKLRDVAPTTSTPEMRENQSKAAKRRYATEAGKAHLNRLHNGHKARTVTEKTREQMSTAQLKAAARRTPEEKTAIAAKIWATRRRRAAEREQGS